MYDFMVFFMKKKIKVRGIGSRVGIGLRENFGHTDIDA